MSAETSVVYPPLPRSLSWAWPCPDDAAVAADKTKVDRATQQVERGARCDRSQGNVGQGVKGTAKGHWPHGGRWCQVQRRERPGALPEDPWELTSLALKCVPWPRLQVGTGPVSAPGSKDRAGGSLCPVTGTAVGIGSWGVPRSSLAFMSRGTEPRNGVTAAGGLMLATFRRRWRGRAHHSYP